jgi:hypothetical protein
MRFESSSVRRETAFPGMGRVGRHVSKAISKAINEANTLDEFRVASESKGLSRAEASAVMRKHGVSPRAMVGWVSHHWITHDKEADRRWLTRAGDARVKALRELIRQG